ncbi:hypothetical protein INR49_004570 [Caranx melampygus]|nr:hypothetical protein INR49_004570 [Caranx melampygus]
MVALGVQFIADQSKQEEALRCLYGDAVLPGTVAVGARGQAMVDVVTMVPVPQEDFTFGEGILHTEALPQPDPLYLRPNSDTLGPLGFPIFSGWKVALMVSTLITALGSLACRKEGGKEEEEEVHRVPSLSERTNRLPRNCPLSRPLFINMPSLVPAEDQKRSFISTVTQSTFKTPPNNNNNTLSSTTLFVLTCHNEVMKLQRGDGAGRRHTKKRFKTTEEDRVHVEDKWTELNNLTELEPLCLVGEEEKIHRDSLRDLTLLISGMLRWIPEQARQMNTPREQEPHPGSVEEEEEDGEST